jgi:hypothetical protein
MIKNVEDMIKKSVSETIVDEMLRELGFYVIRLGKEYAAAPLTQIEQFVRTCGGNLNLKKEDHEFVYSVSYINKLPDFAFVDKNGRINLLEVKFRRNAKLWPKDFELFHIYPKAFLIVVNCDVPDDIISTENKNYEEKLSNLKSTRFHIWNRIEKSNETLNSVLTLKEFLHKEFEIESVDNLLKKYEELVVKWLKKEYEKV